MIAFVWIKLDAIILGIESCTSKVPEMKQCALHCAKAQWKENVAIIILFILIFFLSREMFIDSKLNFKTSQYLQKLQSVLISQSQNPLFYEGRLVEGAKTLTKEVAESTKIDRTSIWLFNDEMTSLVCQQLYRNSEDKWESNIELSIEDHPEFFQNLLIDPIMIIHDVESNIKKIGFSNNRLGHLGIKSLLIVPVIYAGTTIGILSNGNFEKRHWTENEINFMQLIASLFAFAYSIQLSNENEVILERKNSYLEHAAKIIRHDMHSGINTYIPRGVSSLERRLTKKKITELKIEAPLKLIKEGLKHAQRVYRGVYEFTNLVKKDMVLDKEICNLTSSLTEYLSLTAYTDQVQIEELGELEVNEALFCTAIDNLIKNGLKYNDSQTRIVKIYREEDLILVEDNGRGMSSTEFNLLSKPYTRKPDQREAGSGLGLNICVAILEEHGFGIDCELLDKGGTRIIINIKKNNTQ